MEALRGLPSGQNGLTVGERQAGQKQAEEFRRAMQEHGDEQRPQQQPAGATEPPTPTRLQRQAPASRKEDHEVRRIDVYA